MPESASDKNELTRYQKLHLGLMAVGVAAAFATLIFLGRQVSNLAEQTQRQTTAINIQMKAVEGQTKSLDAQRKAFEAQVSQMIMQEQFEISKVLIANPRLLPYFVDGKQISRRHKDFNVVMQIADLHLDFFDGFDDEYVKSLTGMGENGKYRVLWEKYFRDAFATSPALCARFAEVKHWYTDSLASYAKAGCTKTSNFAVNRTLRDEAAQRRLP